MRTVNKRCIICKFVDANPLSLPAPPNYPDFRVEIAPPFTNVGMDHLGPLWVKDIYGRHDAKMHKAYIALTSCCVTRMVHVELQPDLEAQTFVRTLQRIFARVGTPNLIVSDNHKSFRAKSVRDFVKGLSIQWKYIIPRAPTGVGFMKE